MSLMIIKQSLSDIIRGIILDEGSAKELLDAVGEIFKELDKAEIANLMNSFINSKYDNLGGIQDLVLRKFQASGRLKNSRCQ